MRDLHRPGRQRKTQAILAFCLAAIAGSPVPSMAALDVGACAIRVTVSYGSTTLTSGATPFGFSAAPADSLCAPVPNTGNLPASLLTTVNISGTGSSSLAKTCEAAQATGTYSLSFGSAFTSSFGIFAFAGNVGGATIAFIDIASPIFVGVATLSVDPLTSGNVGQATACAGTGMTSIVYRGTLTFSDP